MQNRVGKFLIHSMYGILIVGTRVPAHAALPNPYESELGLHHRIFAGICSSRPAFLVHMGHFVPTLFFGFGGFEQRHRSEFSIDNTHHDLLNELCAEYNIEKDNRPKLAMYPKSMSPAPRQAVFTDSANIWIPEDNAKQPIEAIISIKQQAHEAVIGFEKESYARLYRREVIKWKYNDDAVYSFARTFIYAPLACIAAKYAFSKAWQYLPQQLQENNILYGVCVAGTAYKAWRYLNNTLYKYQEQRADVTAASMTQECPECLATTPRTFYQPSVQGCSFNQDADTQKILKSIAFHRDWKRREAAAQDNNVSLVSVDDREPRERRAYSSCYLHENAYASSVIKAQ